LFVGQPHPLVTMPKTPLPLARHYHVKMQAPRQGVLTTQLYFPDEPMNCRDGMFRRELVMRIAEAGDGLLARFDFVLDTR
jgi:protocatechuate 3,4-dioxygenase beta subunit